MSLQEDILDTSRLRFAGEFDEQVDYLFQNIRLSRYEVEALSSLFQDLQWALQGAWKGCQVHPFGSIITGLGIRTSDVDCYVSIPNKSTEPKAQAKIVMRAKAILSRQYNIFSELFAIPKAKVPIVKFYHIPNGRHCDVSFRSPAAVQNSGLLAYLLHVDRRAVPLAVLIKYWSKIHNLTGTNLMPSYALNILVIFYLQQMDILPSVAELQKSMPPCMIDNWNTSFDDTYNYVPDNDDSLYQLLGGFFNYYGNTFDYKGSVVCPYLGRPLSKDIFKNINDLPEEFDLYKHNIRNKLSQPLRLDCDMCIQDSFDHSRNCAVAVFPKLAHKVISCFKHAANVFVEESSRNFLKGILKKIPGTELPVNNNKRFKGPNKIVKPHVKQNYYKLKRNLQAHRQNNIHALYNKYCKMMDGKS